MLLTRHSALILVLAATGLTTLQCGSDDSAGPKNPSSGSGGGSSTTGSAGSTSGPTGSTTTMQGTGGAGPGSGGGTPGTGGGATGGAGGAAGGAGGGGGIGPGGAGGGGGGMPDADHSVLQRGKDNARTAHFIEPNLTLANAPKMALDTTFMATFSGAMTASPLFLASTTPGKGKFFAVTNSNMVYALDETTGATLWMHSIGMPGTGSEPGISLRGILSTPVIDATTNTIYVAGGVGGGPPSRHEIHALSTDTGMEQAGFPINVSMLKAGNVSFDSSVQIQRSALSLVNGILYVAFGGNFGDQGNYHGWVVAVDTKTPSKVGTWATMGVAEGIWAAGGMASDGNGIFVITGNSHSANASHSNSDGEEILRITDMATPHRDNANLFYPSIWQMMDATDKDFGSNSPQVISVPGSTPSSLLVAPAKPGHVYFLDPNNLGGMGNQLRDLVVANTNTESVYTAPSTYTTAMGVHVAISTTDGSQCPTASGNGQVMSILLRAGSPPTPSIAWCASTGTDDEVRRRSPISTTTDGKTNAIVWFMNGAKLNGYDGDTGMVVFDGGTGMCGGVHRHTSPIAANGRIIAGGDGHLCSWSVH